MSFKDEKLAELEQILRDIREKYARLKQTIDSDITGQPKLERDLARHSRQAEFYREKLAQLDLDRLRSQVDSVKVAILSRDAKAKKFEELQKSLDAFDGMEPSNEDLRDHINELQKKRLSLDMSFTDATITSEGKHVYDMENG